jgi:DMSO/TMAO reductase YedYZ molybdopterin-dependent catalytic subunit
MKRNKILLILVIAVVVLIALWFYFSNLGKLSPEAKRLASVEVREYNGSRLSSVNDFRENSIKGPQHINIATYHLEISGLVDSPKNYSYDDVINKPNYEKVVTLNCVEGWDVTLLWRGVLVNDLLDEVKPTKDANTVIFYAYDGYSVNFPLSYFKDNNIILAYKMNNYTILPERGYPFMLVAESKWGYKWIKWITKIQLSNDTEYKGYWESRGYSGEGNLNESYYS